MKPGNASEEYLTLSGALLALSLTPGFTVFASAWEAACIVFCILTVVVQVSILTCFYAWNQVAQQRLWVPAWQLLGVLLIPTVLGTVVAFAAPEQAVEAFPAGIGPGFLSGLFVGPFLTSAAVTMAWAWLAPATQYPGGN